MTKQRDHHEMEKRRLKAARYFERGLATSEVARKLGVKRQSAHEWRKSWVEGGKESLLSSGPAGRKSRLSTAQQQEVVEALLEGPQNNGYATEVWTLPRVRALIRKTTGENYHESHVSRVLRDLGFSCQRPERRAIERDEKKIAQWRRVKWPAIKKSHRRESAHRLYRRKRVEHPSASRAHLGTTRPDARVTGNVQLEKSLGHSGHDVVELLLPHPRRQHQGRAGGEVPPGIASSPQEDQTAHRVGWCRHTQIETGWRVSGLHQGPDRR